MRKLIDVMNISISTENWKNLKISKSPNQSIPNHMHSYCTKLRPPSPAIPPPHTHRRYPPWLANGVHDRQLIDTNPLSMVLVPAQKGGTMSVYNPIYGLDNVSYAVTIPHAILQVQSHTNTHAHSLCLSLSLFLSLARTHTHTFCMLLLFRMPSCRCNHTQTHTHADTHTIFLSL